MTLLVLALFLPVIAVGIVLTLAFEIGVRRGWWPEDWT